MTYFADKIIENKILKRTGIVDIGAHTKDWWYLKVLLAHLDIFIMKRLIVV